MTQLLFTIAIYLIVDHFSPLERLFHKVVLDWSKLIHILHSIAAGSQIIFRLIIIQWELVRITIIPNGRLATVDFIKPEYVIPLAPDSFLILLLVLLLAKVIR